jgi:hypothetical protein
MAMYHMVGKRLWPGAFAATAAAAQMVGGLPSPTPATPFQVQTWLKAGSIAAGDTVWLDGQYPVTLDDAADWPATSIPAITAPIVNTGAGNRVDTDAIFGRNVHFGNDSDNASGSPSCATGVMFTATGVGPDGYNVDMRGATVNAQRQACTLMFEGYDMVIVGFNMRASDWNPIAAGGITAAAASNLYASEASFENHLMWIRGGWGSAVYGNTGHGGNRGGKGLYIELKCEASVFTLNQGKRLDVYLNDIESCGDQMIEVRGATGMNGSGRNWLPINSVVEIRENNCHDAYWGDGSTENANLDHGNLIGVYLCAMNGSRVLVHHNTLSGDCQDAMVLLGANNDAYYNTFTELCPGRTFGDVINVFNGVSGGSTEPGYATGWDNRSETIAAGNCIKAGLSGAAYQGTTGAGWLLIGTPSGSGYLIDEPRQRVYCNRGDGWSGYFITGNGARSFLAVANEGRTTRGYGLSGGGNSTGMCQLWLAHNYVEAIRALDIYDNYRVYAFSNILKGSTHAAVRSGASSVVYGSKNVTDGATSGTFLWTGTINAAADYVFGVGPDQGGNCDGEGDWYGLLGARMPVATTRDIAGKRWRQNSLSIGPRQLH